MRKLILIFIMISVGIAYTYASAENQDVEVKSYVVSNKKGKARFVPVEKDGDNWKWVKSGKDLYLENGVELTGFEIPRNDALNYKGSNAVYRGGLVVSYEGKYYIVPFPEKDIIPVDEKGELTSDLGVRNYLSNTKLGDFYRTWTPGLIALGCAIFSAIFLFIGIFRDKVPMFIRWCFVTPLCIISLLEIGAACSLGTDAAWWVNPEDVGYWVATPVLIPYSLVAVMMVFSYKLYGIVGKVEGVANIVVSAFLIIGTILTVISAIFVVIDFILAVCILLGAGWMFKGIDSKDFSGNTINSGPFGTYKTDKYGKTTRID